MSQPSLGPTLRRRGTQLTHVASDSGESGIEEWPLNPPASDPHVHVGVFCDGCLAKGETTFMQGARWKCVQCPSYDLCQTCYDDLQRSRVKTLARPRHMVFTHPTDHLFIVHTATYEQTPGWVEGGDMDPARLEYYRSRLPLSPLLPQDSWKFDKRHPNRVEPNLYFDFWLVDLANIDEMRHTVDVDIWIYCQWTPAIPELRLPGPPGEDPVILPFPISHSELVSFWDRHIHASSQRPQLFFPQLHMIGPHGLQPVFNPVQNPRLTYSDGLSEDLHFRGPVRYSPNLAWYPFDNQVVILTFTVPASCDRLLLTVPPEVFVSRAARAAKSGMSGWRLTDSHIRRLFHSYAILGEFPRDEISISQMSDYTSSIELKLRFSRRWGYQILQKVVPLDLIVFAGWIVFLIPKGDPEEDVQIARLALGVTVLLALAAFNVSITAGMPKNPSPTLMDFHAVWSFFLVTYTTLASLDLPRRAWLPLIHAGVSRGLVSAMLFVAEHVVVIALVLAKKTGYLDRAGARISSYYKTVRDVGGRIARSLTGGKTHPGATASEEVMEIPTLPVASTATSVIGDVNDAVQPAPTPLGRRASAFGRGRETVQHRAPGPDIV